MTDATPPRGNQPTRPGARPKPLNSADLAPRPAFALYAAIAVAASAVIGAASSIAFYFQTSYLRGQAVLANTRAKAEDQKYGSDLYKYIDQQVAASHKSAIIGAIIVLLALGFISYGLYKGRHWARWGTLIVWFLASFTGTFVGLSSLLSVGSAIPLAVKVPSFIASLLLVFAVLVVLTNKTVGKWLALSKPVPAPGQPARRGLFAPRVPPASARTTATAPATNSVNMNKPAQPNASRTKKRATTASVAKGADLGRARAKAASKSRRTEA